MMMIVCTSLKLSSFHKVDVGDEDPPNETKFLGSLQQNERHFLDLPPPRRPFNIIGGH